MRLFELTLAFVLAGCAGKSDPAENTAPAEKCPKLTTECTGTVPSFENDVQPILDAQCNTCHTAAIEGAPWPFDSYDDTLDWKNLVLSDLQGCGMPPADAGAPLPEKDRETLNAWIICGAPDN
jgi:cytochrome c5